MPSKSKIELFAAIRPGLADGGDVRPGSGTPSWVHRRMVREALVSPWPTGRKPLPPDLQALINAVRAGQGLNLYLPP